MIVDPCYASISGLKAAECWSLDEVRATLRPISWLGNNMTLPQVTGGKLHWRVFEVGKGLETDGVELQVGDIIEKIDDKRPNECTTKRSGCPPPRALFCMLQLYFTV